MLAWVLQGTICHVEGLTQFVNPQSQPLEYNEIAQSKILGKCNGNSIFVA